MTGRGCGVLAAGAVLLVAGGWLGYPEAAAVGAAAVVSVLLSLASARRLPRLTVTRTVEPALVTRGGSCHAVLEVSHDSTRTVRLAAEDGRIPVPPMFLRPGEVATVRYDVPTARRGPVRLGPLWVGRRDPLGLAGAGRVVGDGAVVRVHPTLHPLGGLPAALRRGTDDDRGTRPGAGAVSDQLRRYATGDDLRQVHWRSSARLGDLMVRGRTDTGRPGLVVLLDDRAGAHGDDTFESACEAAGSIVAAALRADIAVRLVTTGGAELAGRPGLAGFLHLLAEVALRGADQPEHGLALAVTGRLAGSGDVLVCLTGPSGAGALSDLRRRYPSTRVVVFGGPAAPFSARDGADFAARWPAAWAR
jgi:uncharacterized protein (DUF58 family)